MKDDIFNELKQSVEHFSKDCQIPLMDLWFDKFSTNNISIIETDRNKRIMSFNDLVKSDDETEAYNSLNDDIFKEISVRCINDQMVLYCQYIRSIRNEIKLLDIKYQKKQEYSKLNISVLGKKETTLDLFNDDEIQTLSEFITIKIDAANEILMFLTNVKRRDTDSCQLVRFLKNIDVVELAIISKRRNIYKGADVTVHSLADRICDAIHLSMINNIDELIEEINNRKNKFPLGRSFISIIKHLKKEKQKRKL